MTKRDYRVVLEGVDAHDLSVAVLRNLCDLFLEGAQRCARLTVEGRSVARGTAPTWLSAAADLRVTHFAQGSLELGLRATPLAEAAPEVFAQQSLFPAGTAPEATALDLFLDAADDAAAGLRDSECLDSGVLDTLAQASALFAAGGTRLRVIRGAKQTLLDADSAHTIRSLVQETPRERIDRVKGVLDTLTVSTRALVLRMHDGALLRGFAGTVSLDELKSLLGEQVVLEGRVAFRPSGRVLRIQVESALPASAGEPLESLPVVVKRSSRGLCGSLAQGSRAMGRVSQSRQDAA